MNAGASENSKTMDDEYLSSIKDFTQGNNPIYSTNNPALDRISPSMLWKASSASSPLTINKILPVTTSTGNVGGNENTGMVCLDLFFPSFLP